MFIFNDIIFWYIYIYMGLTQKCQCHFIINATFREINMNFEFNSEGFIFSSFLKIICNNSFISNFTYIFKEVSQSWTQNSSVFGGDFFTGLLLLRGNNTVIAVFHEDQSSCVSSQDFNLPQSHCRNLLMTITFLTALCGFSGMSYCWPKVTARISWEISWDQPWN